jgi:hypothetical protein
MKGLSPTSRLVTGYFDDPGAPLRFVLKLNRFDPPEDLCFHPLRGLNGNFPYLVQIDHTYHERADPIMPQD